MSRSDSSAPGFVDRVQSFLAENRRVILIGTAAAAIAVGGAAYYASTSRSSLRSDADRKKDKKKSKKRKSGTDSPILEELPKAAEQDDLGQLNAHCLRSDI